MWNDTTPAVQTAAKAHFGAHPGTRTMLATADGNLFADDGPGKAFARKYARASGAAVVRLTRAGGVVACFPGHVGLGASVQHF